MQEYFKKVKDNLLKAEHPESYDVFQRLIVYKRVLENQEINAYQDNDFLCDVQEDLIKIGLITKRSNQLQLSTPLHQRIFDEDWVEQKLQENFVFQELSIWGEELADFSGQNNQSNFQNILIEQILKLTSGSNSKINVRDLVSHIISDETSYFYPLFYDRLLDRFKQLSYCDVRCNETSELYRRVVFSNNQEINVNESDREKIKELKSIDLVKEEGGKIKPTRLIYTLIFIPWKSEELDSVPGTNPNQPHGLLQPKPETKPKKPKWWEKSRKWQLIIVFIISILLAIYFKPLLGLLIESSIKPFLEFFIESPANNALKEPQQLDSLIQAIQAGNRLKPLIKNNMKFEAYPTVKPVHALQYINDYIYEKNQLKSPDYHDATIRSISFSQDGEYIPSADEDGNIRIWKWKEYSNQLIENVQQGIVRSIKFFKANQKQILASVGKNNQTVRFWNTSGEAIGEPIKVYEEGEIINVNISDDGKILTTLKVNDRVVKLWKINVISDKEIQLEEINPPLQAENDHKITLVKFIPNQDNQNYAIATVEDKGKVKLWKIPQNLQIPIDSEKWENKLLNLESGGIQDIDFTSDGRFIITAGRSGRVTVWNLEGKAISKPLETNNQEYAYVNVSPKKQFLAITGESSDSDIQFYKLPTSDFNGNDWDLESHKIKQGIKAYRNERIYSISFSPDGKYLVASGANTTVQLWDVYKLLHPTSSFHNFQETIKSLYIGKSSDNNQRLVILRSDGTVEIKDCQSETSIPLKEDNFIKSISLSPDKKHFATVDSQRNIQLWNFSSKESIDSEEIDTDSYNQPISQIILGKNNKFIIIQQDNMASLRDFSGSPRQILNDNSDRVKNASFSPTGNFIITVTTDGAVKLWDSNNIPKDLTQMHNENIEEVKYSPKGNFLATLAHYKELKLWNWQESSVDSYELKLKRDMTPIKDVEIFDFSFDEQLIATAEKSDNKVKLWDYKGRQVAEFEGEWNKTEHLGFTPNGKELFAVGDHGVIQKWIIEDQEKELKLEKLIDKGCKWLSDYLETYPERYESTKTICLKSNIEKASKF